MHSYLRFYASDASYSKLNRKQKVSLSVHDTIRIYEYELPCVKSLKLINLVCNINCATTGMYEHLFNHIQYINLEYVSI